MKSTILSCIVGAALFFGASASADDTALSTSSLTQEIMSELSDEGVLNGLSDRDVEDLEIFMRAYVNKSLLDMADTELNLSETGGDYIFGSIKKAVKKVGSTVKKTTKKVGSGVKSAAKKVGSGVKSAAKTVGKATVTVVKTVGKGISAVIAEIAPIAEPIISNYLQVQYRVPGPLADLAAKKMIAVVKNPTIIIKLVKSKSERKKLLGELLQATKDSLDIGAYIGGKVGGKVGSTAGSAALSSLRNSGEPRAISKDIFTNVDDYAELELSLDSNGALIFAEDNR